MSQFLRSAEMHMSEYYVSIVSTFYSSVVYLGMQINSRVVTQDVDYTLEFPLL